LLLSPCLVIFIAYSSTLMMEAYVPSDTLINYYGATEHYIPKDDTLKNRRMEEWSTTSCIRKLGADWIGFSPGEEATALPGLQDGWASEQICTLWGRENDIFLPKIEPRFYGSPHSNQFTLHYHPMSWWSGKYFC
jgi:hypothetical protein